MANPRHLQILKRGIKVWNEWRRNHPKIEPDLHRANLVDTDFAGANFRGANLSRVNLCHAKLNRANLIGADLTRADMIGAEFFSANLTRANLKGAKLNGAKLSSANLTDTNFRDADLSRTELINANLKRADLCASYLRHADLSHANLCDAQLRSAKLSNAKLISTDLSRADLSSADMAKTDLTNATLSVTNLSQANINSAWMGDTIFANLDLRDVTGLKTVRHWSPSDISISTIYRSQGKIPEEFLRGCGVPDDFISYARSLSGQALEFYSCFISYSHKDEKFAKRLHSRMREAGLRVWYAPEEMKGGEKVYEQIDRAIQLHDRLLLVLSVNSLKSEWVMTEIRRARKTEIKEQIRKIFPIRLVDFETIRDWECFDADTGKDLAVEVREYFIPDFSNWKDQDAFEAAFDKLLRDLTAEAQS